MTGLAPSKAQRLLDLLAFLASHRFPVQVEQILDSVPGYSRHSGDASMESVRRKFERDKAELRAAGIQIETIGAGSGSTDEGYRLRSRDFYLPVLKLLRDDEDTGRTVTSKELRVRSDELRIALEGLAHAERLPAFPFRAAARSALRKLTFDLAGQEAPNLPPLDDPAPPVLHLPRGPDDLVQEHLALLSDALLRRKRVRFRYYAIGRDERSDRRVEPHGLIYQGSHWYLVAHDLDRDGRRVFRVDRVDRVDVSPERPGTPDFELPPDHTLEPVREREAWELGAPDAPAESVTVHFEPPLHLLAHRNGWGDPDPPPSDGPSPPQRRAFRVNRPAPLLRWVLSFGSAARVVEPASAVAEWARLAERVRTVHGSAPDTEQADALEEGQRAP